MQRFRCFSPLCCPRDAQRVCSVKSNWHKTRPSWLSPVPGGSRAVPHATADDAVHGAFMTLPAYSRSKEGEGQELGFDGHSFRTDFWLTISAFWSRQGCQQ